MNQRPTAEEYAPYYETYVSKVKGDSIMAVLEAGQTEMLDFLKQVPPDKWDYRYAPDKWTVKEMLLHLIDAERVFSYRALRIGRNDTTPLAGFGHEEYVPYSNAANRSPESIASEYQAVRQSSMELFRHLREEDLPRIGTASGYPVSCRALAYILAGHEQHHLGILRERYL